MAEENKGVEVTVEGAPAQQEVDYEAVLKQKDDELTQVRQERENYRKGMLKAKGKLPADEEADPLQPENVDERFRRIAREEILSTKEAQLQTEKDSALKAILKRNKELELALKNRGQVTSNSGLGSNQDKPEIKTDSYFSPDQINALKAKGWDDKKIEEAKKNMLKGTQAPK